MDIDDELRKQLLRAQPRLSPDDANCLISASAADCLELRERAVEEQDGHEDFFTFCYLDEAALAAIYHETTVEFFAFAADESLIDEGQKLAMGNVQEFMEVVCARFGAPEKGVVIPLAEALPWMEAHRDAEEEDEEE